MKPVVYMSSSDQEDSVVLHKFPRALHCKTLVDMPFSKTLTVDWEHEYLFVIFLFAFFAKF